LEFLVKILDRKSEYSILHVYEMNREQEAGVFTAQAQSTENARGWKLQVPMLLYH